MASETKQARATGERPGERPMPPLPEAGSLDAAFLDGLNAVYGDEHEADEARVLSGVRAAARRALERER